VTRWKDLLALKFTILCNSW